MSWKLDCGHELTEPSSFPGALVKVFGTTSFRSIVFPILVIVITNISPVLSVISTLDHGVVPRVIVRPFAGNIVKWAITICSSTFFLLRPGFTLFRTRASSLPFRLNVVFLLGLRMAWAGRSLRCATQGLSCIASSIGDGMHHKARISC